jgi:hypothetical protein
MPGLGHFAVESHKIRGIMRPGPKSGIRNNNKVVHGLIYQPPGEGEAVVHDLCEVTHGCLRGELDVYDSKLPAGVGWRKLSNPTVRSDETAERSRW